MARMAVPDTTWLTRCRLWTRLLDLFVRDDQACRSAEVFATNMDAAYMVLMSDSYGQGRQDGLAAGEQASAETIQSLRQKVAALEKSLATMTGNISAEQDTTTLH
jgi:hypothetical protein